MVTKPDDSRSFLVTFHKGISADPANTSEVAHTNKQSGTGTGDSGDDCGPPTATSSMAGWKNRETKCQ